MLPLFRQAKLHGLTCCATPRREALLQIAAYGPAAGAAASLVAVLVGLALSAADLGGGISVQSSAFEDSLLLGLLGEQLHHKALRYSLRRVYEVLPSTVS